MRSLTLLLALLVGCADDATVADAKPKGPQWERVGEVLRLRDPEMGVVCYRAYRTDAAISCVKE